MNNNAAVKKALGDVLSRRTDGEAAEFWQVAKHRSACIAG
jgi:hypothetical protein